MFDRNDPTLEGERFLVILSCLHTTEFQKPTPRPGEYVWCYKCVNYKRAVVAPTSYHITCRDCTRAPVRDYGDAKLRVEIDADKHARKFPGHRVRVMQGDNLVSERMHEPQPSLLDAPPF